MVVLATVPLVWVRVNEDPYVPPEEVEISNPVGAVTVISAVRLLAEALNDCAEAAVPAQLLNAIRVPEVVMVRA